MFQGGVCQAALEQDVTLGESRLMTGHLDQSQRRSPRPLSPPSLGHGAVARAARCVAEPRYVKGHRDEQASGTRPGGREPCRGHRDLEGPVGAWAEESG